MNDGKWFYCKNCKEVWYDRKTDWTLKSWCPFCDHKNEKKESDKIIVRTVRVKT